MNTVNINANNTQNQVVQSINNSTPVETSIATTSSNCSEPYVRPLLNAVRTDPTMKIILEKVEGINYQLVYVDKLGLRDRYDELRKSLETAKDKERKAILKALRPMRPSDSACLIILLEEAMRITDGIDMGICVDIDSHYPYLYNGRYWELVNERFLKEFLAELASNNAFNYYHMRTPGAQKNLFEQYASICANIPPEYNENQVKINLKNGSFLINSKTEALLPFDKNDFFKYQLPFDYDPKAECPKFLKFLNEVLPDKSSQMVLAEYIGYIFVKGMSLEKCLVLKGGGANGKSVVFNIIQSLIGRENMCSYTLSNLCDSSGYYRAALSNYLLNYSSEIGGKGVNSDTMKKLVSNEPVDARSPYGKPFILRNYGKFIFNANKFPSNIEHTNAYFRRFIIIDFNVTIPDDKQDKNLASKIIETELSGIFNWVLEGLRRIRENEKFTFSQKIQDTIEELKQESNSVAMFITENNYKPTSKVSMPLKLLREMYAGYCRDSGCIPVGQKEFSSRIEALGFTIKRGGSGNVNMVYCGNNADENLAAAASFMGIEK